MAELFRLASGTADGSGNLSIAFDPVTFGRVWTGTLYVINAPSASSWTGARNGGPWPGTQVGGAAANVEARDGDTVTLMGTGYVPGTRYTAQLTGNDIALREVGAWSAPFPGSTR